MNGHKFNMKTPLIIANWKMQMAPTEAPLLARKIVKATEKYPGAEVVLCPAFTEIAVLAEALRGSRVALGAQDCFWEAAGAFTGEISPTTLLSYGVRYVLLGHSERREHLGETGEMVRKKARAVLAQEMVPVVCIGESFAERAEGQKEIVLIRQLREALDGLWLNKPERLVVAYEPIWVIGSGQAVMPKEAEHTHEVIRQTLYDILPQRAVDEQVKIIYGGSVDPTNIGPFLAELTIDGVLVGTSSLDATVFSAIITSVSKNT